MTGDSRKTTRTRAVKIGVSVGLGHDAHTDKTCVQIPALPSEDDGGDDECDDDG